MPHSYGGIIRSHALSRKKIVYTSSKRRLQGFDKEARRNCVMRELSKAFFTFLSLKPFLRFF